VLDSFKQMGALAGLLKNREALQEAGERVRARLAELRVTGRAGGGVVRATANGQMRILAVEVDPSLASGLGADDASRAMGEQLIAEAVNEALSLAQEAAQAEVAREAEAMGLGDLAGQFGKLLP
jgi:DNA-binding YbaB/EbfC family protein